MSSVRPAPSASPPRRFVVHVLIYSLWALLVVGGLLLLLARSLIPVWGGVGASVVAGGVLIAAILLYIRAYRRAQVREHTIIARTQEEVFQRLAREFFATRAARMAQAAPPDTTILVEQTSVGPVGVGTTGREVIERGGQRSEWDYLITVYEVPRCIAFVATSNGAFTQILTRYEFAPIPGGTRLTITYEYTLRGLWRFATPFYVRSVQRSLHAGTAQLKVFLEG